MARPLREPLRSFSLFLALFITFYSVVVAQADKPSYLANISQCARPAQWVIITHRLPANQIHSCRAEALDLAGRSASLVYISYGPARDCPAGCSYTNFVGTILPGDPLEILELPGPDLTHLSMLLAQRLSAPESGKPGLRCTPPSGLFDFEVVRYRTTVAWHATLREPFHCRWGGPAAGRSTTTGGFYAYLKDGHLAIDPDRLTVEKQPPRARP